MFLEIVLKMENVYNFFSFLSYSFNHQNDDHDFFYSHIIFIDLPTDKFLRSKPQSLSPLFFFFFFSVSLNVIHWSNYFSPNSSLKAVWLLLSWSSYWPPNCIIAKLLWLWFGTIWFSSAHIEHLFLLWVWGNSKSWWWTGRPGLLQSIGSQRVGHD